MHKKKPRGTLKIADNIKERKYAWKKIVQKIIVGGVLINNDKALIIQRNDDEDVFSGMWELPSGKREPLETTKEALKREFLEEVGLRVKVLVPISVFDYQINKTDEIRDSTQINFIVETMDANTEIKISKEHKDFKWINMSQIEKYNIYDSTAKAILKAFAIYSLIRNKKQGG